jgi:hypothetical protein
VSSLRNFLGTHRRLASLLIAMAIAMKALVPAGYMLAPQVTVLTVTICADALGKRITHDIAVPKKAGHGEGSAEQSKGANTCSWSSLSMAALGGAAPELLALALAFVLALGFMPSAPSVARIASWLRPPLRAPPILA